MTVNFLDVMIIDSDTISFLLSDLSQPVLDGRGRGGAARCPCWCCSGGSIRFACALRSASLGAIGCLAGAERLSLRRAARPDEAFDADELRVAVRALRRRWRSSTSMTRGLMESDASRAADLAAAAPAACQPAQRLPHIIMVLDEVELRHHASCRASRCRRAIGAISVRSTARRARSLVEGAGGPSWYTEYNVLTGLSARSFGRFADFVTRIAAGRVKRGLPNALRRCGYSTFSLYPWLRRVPRRAPFPDDARRRALPRRRGHRRTSDLEPDSSIYNAAADLIARERGSGPLFIFAYLAANHFPWTIRYRAGPDAGLARSRQRASERSTNTCAART